MDKRITPAPPTGAGHIKAIDAIEEAGRIAGLAGAGDIFTKFDTGFWTDSCKDQDCSRGGKSPRCYPQHSCNEVHACSGGWSCSPRDSCSGGHACDGSETCSNIHSCTGGRVDAPRTPEMQSCAQAAIEVRRLAVELMRARMSASAAHVSPSDAVKK